ncbi:MAG: threonine--tRNA ligase [SAR202 cluster bacterium]|nr:threonine--tRNA ligase [SAR202 cluster bacterium]
MSDIQDLRDKIRHSAAHLLAESVLKIYPDAKLTIGPAISDGFYYDFDIDQTFSQEDLVLIERQMKRSIKRNTKFEGKELSKKEALIIYKDNPYKTEIINSMPKDEVLTEYSHSNGNFVDLCKGGHVEKTGEIKAVKLLSIAGAYWRGDENNKMLQRIYGTAFESNEELDKHLLFLEEASRRDHRKLGNELDLYSISQDVGSGMILWHPKGSFIRSKIEDYWKSEHIKDNYDLIYTPHVGKSDLWSKSGHLDNFKENMFSSINMDNNEYYLKPMNCPFHISYYKNKLRSYRDLPMRIGELGTVYRYEKQGVLHGLLRVRGFTQDDAHIFCMPDQVVQEFNSVLDLTFRIYDKFDFKNYKITLSTKPEKYVGEDKDWDFAEKTLEKILNEKGIEYELDEGGGAFYGPKIDIHIEDAIGRLWQCTTVQFDFNLPERFDLKYISTEGDEIKPIMIHRALLGSVERFFGVLVEHYAGSFPMWLAPVQIMIIPIADRHIDYCNQISDVLKEKDFRSEVNDSSERMNAKIREAQMQKIPYMIVIGDNEISQNKLSIRTRSGENISDIDLNEFFNLLND